MENRIINYLIEKGFIKEEDLRKIELPDKSLKNTSLEEIFIQKGLLEEEKFYAALEEFFGVPFAKKEDFPEEPILVNNISIQFMKEFKFIPVRLNNNKLTVIMANPRNSVIELESRGKKVRKCSIEGSNL